MYSAYKLNKQDDNIQPWCTPFPIWNQSVFPCPVLTVASWPAYRFLKRQVRWSCIPISFRIFQFIVIHTVKGFGIGDKAEIDDFLEPSCFFHDPADVGNLISCSSTFSKTSLNIWKFTVHILLKPGLENFEHYLTSLWDVCNCVVVRAFFGIAFLWDWNAKVGSQETPGVTGKFGLGIWKEEGQRLIEFCQENALVISNTLFQQRKRRLYTWTSPDGQHWNQIDYNLCSQRWRSSIQSAKTRPGADCASDQELHIAKFKCKLKKVGKPLDHSGMI